MDYIHVYIYTLLFLIIYARLKKNAKLYNNYMLIVKYQYKICLYSLNFFWSEILLQNINDNRESLQNE